MAYDWSLLRHSLPLVYREANNICLTIDRDRRSWSGQKFDFDEGSFFHFINEIDIDRKIQIIQEDFHISGLTPMQNEVRQRNKMAEHLGKGGWHIQLDCDEYFLEFGVFVKFLKGLPGRKRTRVNMACPLITLFKKTSGGFFYVVPAPGVVEFIQIATQEPSYEYGRRNGNFNICTDFFILHQSWARTETDVRIKVENWGHRLDFDGEAYVQKWLRLDASNFKTFKNFHPLQPEIWPALNFIRAADEAELILHPPCISFPYSKWELRLKNNRNLAQMKSLVPRFLPW